MLVSIVVPDNIVTIDGFSLLIDCKELAAVGIHAVQWDGLKGTLETVHPSGAPCTVNEDITDFSYYQDWVDQHAKLVAEVPEVAYMKQQFIASKTRRIPVPLGGGDAEYRKAAPQERRDTVPSVQK